MDQFTLADLFPSPSEEDWLALAGKALGKAPFEVLRTELHEGIKTEPLYTKSEGRPPLIASRGWRVVQPLTASVEQFNDDLANGAEAIAIDLSAVPTATADNLKYFLGSDIAYYLTPGSSPADAAYVLAAAGEHGITGSAGFDPLTSVAVSGEAPVEKSALAADYTDAACHILDRYPQFVPFTASGEAWDGAGGTAVQELSLTLSAAVSYWRGLCEAGLSIDESARAIGFSLTGSPDIFLTIAKFRAMRMLWARALEAAGVSSSSALQLLGKMSARTLTAYDSHTNLLRGTAAVFGAAIGGATGIEVLPFDSMGAGASAMSRRLARNTSFILQKESYLSAVADAAAGSGYVETLTNALAAKSWALFQEVEARGGLLACLESGFIHALLHRAANGKARDVAFRRDKITGVSVFPNLSEDPLSEGLRNEAHAEARHPFSGKLPLLPAPAKGERFAALVSAAREGLSLQQLRSASRRVSAFAASPLGAPKRDAESFERLRKQSDKALQTIGSRPPVFLAVLGKPEEYRARASWVQGFFAAGGIETIVPDGAFENIEALAAAFKQSPAPMACLCSSNAAYAAGSGAAAALKKAGAVAVYLAGPASILKTLPQEDAIAIDRLIYEGCNALALLREAQAVFQVEEMSLAAQKEAAEAGFEVSANSHDVPRGAGD